MNKPPLPVPRLDVELGTLYYRPIETGLAPVCLQFSCPPETRTPFVQDRLTEVGHSIDGNVFQALCGFVFQCAIALILLTNIFAIDGEFLSCSVNTGFFSCIATPPWTWQCTWCRSFDKELPEDHVVIFDRITINGWGAYVRNKNICERTSAENVGGLIRGGRCICGTLWYILLDMNTLPKVLQYVGNL